MKEKCDMCGGAMVAEGAAPAEPQQPEEQPAASDTDTPNGN